MTRFAWNQVCDCVKVNSSYLEWVILLWSHCLAGIQPGIIQLHEILIFVEKLVIYFLINYEQLQIIIVNVARMLIK